MISDQVTFKRERKMLTDELVIFEAVNDLAEEFDTTCPDWFWIVNPDTLDMTSFTLCIMGQLAGNYLIGAGRVDIDNSKVAINYGSNTSKRPLEASWVEEINNRRSDWLAVNGA